MNSYASTEYLAMIALERRSRSALNGGAASSAVDANEARLNEQKATHTEDISCECRIPAVPKASVKEKERLPKSFDVLAAHRDRVFGRLAAGVGQLAKAQRVAEKQAEQFRHRLLGGRSS